MSSRTRAASDGSAVDFASLVGFGDVHGGTIGTEFIAQRTAAPRTSGWVTHGITPAQDPLPIAGLVPPNLEPTYDELAPNLEGGVFRAYRPITSAPNVAGLLNLYVRRDLRTPGSGFFQLISDPGFAIPPIAFSQLERPYVAGASGDLSHVFFESRMPLDRDIDVASCSAFAGCPVQLYESVDGSVRLAGILPNGTPAATAEAGRGAMAGVFNPHMVSTDGTRVFFRAPAGGGDIYMRVHGATTVQLNASEKSAPESSQAAVLWTASADGRRVFFSTSEGLVDGDDDGADDYYLYDVDAPAGHHLTLISRDGEPSVVDAPLGVIGAGDDGHYLYFMMFGQLVPGEEALVAGIYVWHDGMVRFVGAFTRAFNIDLNTLNYNWTGGDVVTRARVAGDGTHLAFATTDDDGFRGRWGFSGYDHGAVCDGAGCQELYVYDAVDGRLRCASCNPSGALPTESVRINTRVEQYASALSSTPYLSRVISKDGRWAFFTSKDALVPEDVNGKFDAYGYDTAHDRVFLLSSGKSTDDSYFLDAGASGEDAFFVTRERLVGWDRDGNYDLYDARVGGGFPDPVPPALPCAGDACQRVPDAPGVPDAGASRAFEGKGDAPGRLAPRHAKHKKRCARGKRRVVRRGKVRCVRKKARRAAGSRANGGVGR